jgi:broad specificity phosphatase PhoE
VLQDFHIFSGTIYDNIALGDPGISRERVIDAARVTDGNLAVVTHGLVCHSLAQRQLHLPADVSTPLRWNNASLTIIEPPAPWKVRLLNCVVHLDDDTQTGIV